ncbi:hypothetical protein IW140_003518 [Coemansia sp. RSA 1813]|nr:hypothetical protein EV178_003393 [Coemansia sp. RSA 1646]KAJ1772934.1 hypothetical protein LPJ74_001074 [Coemansia sp. RSA 1843]KAJ2093510.1 hypothetical protein IW138_000362 [Coemansia sp. RSA 986]KAJ2214327.1 hypothetical protein EV179_003108 [Coemansia sp. RSA 487]KAJ2568893.1 hypothetical protein IW140_003518 [Coemansia sp. RSA 1813]
MVSYTDLLPLKQPETPVAVDLSDPVPQKSDLKSRKNSKAGHSARRRRSSNQTSPEEWLRIWDKLHNKVLYFRGVTEDALPELQRLFKSCRGIRLNVDPHESLDISGNVEFRNVYDTEKAMAILNNRRLKETKGTLIMTPLTDSEIGPPPNAGSVCIKHIPDDATEASLYDLLRPSGTLYSCSIPTQPSKQSKGTAYACFVELVYAEAAIAQLNFTEYLGNTVSIQLARQPRQARSRTSSSGDGSGNEKAKGSEKVSANGSATEPQKPEPTVQGSPASNRSEKANSNRTTGMASTSQAKQMSHPSAPPHESQQPEQQQRQQQQEQQQNSSHHATSPGSSTSEGPGGGLGGVIVPGKLFVTNLHPTVSHKELFALFKRYGYIQSARVSIEPVTKKSRGHGIVQFSDPNAALEALRECQNADIKGRKITLYQYEHVNRNPVSSPPHVADGSSQNSNGHGTEPDLEPGDSGQIGTVPFPRSDSVSSTQQSDPLLDPAMLRNLSEGSRNEILMQKLVAAVAASPAVDVLDASQIVSSFIQRPLEDVLAMLSDPALLASEWEHEQRASTHLPQPLQTMATPASQTTSPTGGAANEADGSVGRVAHQLQAATVADEGRKQPERGGIHLRDYDTETEEFIEMLLSKAENVRKMKLGSKLFPMIKGMGYSESTKLTVWILDHMGQDVRTLAYTLNDTARLRQIVDEAQLAIGAGQ